jgi:hypothetical protein
MLERLHDHINEELRVNTRTDTIFILTAVIFNFVMLGINSAMATEATDNRTDITPMIILSITLVLSLLVNGISITGLLTGRTTRKKLSQGLLKMYADVEVVQYYDESLLTNYMRRYVMFISIIGLLGTTSILIPLVILLTA